MARSLVKTCGGSPNLVQRQSCNRVATQAGIFLWEILGRSSRFDEAAQAPGLQLIGGATSGFTLDRVTRETGGRGGWRPERNLQHASALF
jgi:hypothetical protein